MRFVLILLIAATLSAADTSLATIRTSGQYDTDGTVLYSVYVATGPQKLTGIAVGGTVPLGTRFIESLDIPAGVKFEGVRDNVAVWSLSEIPADRLIGPFTFRAKPDGASPVITEPAAAVSYQEPESGIAEYAGKETVLVALENSGSIIFDQRGTLNEKNENAPVQIGKTGVLVFIPEGAVRSQTTLTIERQAIDNDKLPKTAEPTWWCGLYAVAISPDEMPSKNFAFAFPTRRQVTLGLPAIATPVGTKSATTNRAFGFGSSNCGFPQFGFATCSTGFGGQFGTGFQGQFGFGVSTADRARATASAAQLSTALGKPTTPVASITDGTSNTIIAILIGLR